MAILIVLIGGMLIGPFTLTKMFKFCLNYPLGQLSKFSTSALSAPSTVIDRTLYSQTREY